MIHVLTIGASLSGKTTLNKCRAAGLRSRGIRVAVLDPMRDSWPADYQTHDPEAFQRFVRMPPPERLRERWALFIDESGSSVDRYDPRWDFLATTGRHLGCVSHFVAHRLKQVSPTIRGQCMTRFVFLCEQEDAEALAKSPHGAALLEASSLPKLHFLRWEAFKGVSRGRIEFRRGKPVVTYTAAKVARAPLRC